MTAFGRSIRNSHKKKARPGGDSPINMTETKFSANVVIKHSFPSRNVTPPAAYSYKSTVRACGWRIIFV